MNGQLDANAMARLTEAMAKSRKIMAMDNQVSKIASSKRDLIESSFNDDGNTVLMESPKPKTMPTQPMQRATINESRGSKLPKEILESFKKEPIGSGMGMAELPQELFEAQTVKEEPIVETRQVVTETVQQPIDYSMIRMIVEESVRKNISAFTKKLMTENKNNDSLDAMISTNGGFKFLTKNGDIYEAKLIKKGNIKNKN